MAAFLKQHCYTGCDTSPCSTGEPDPGPTGSCTECPTFAVFYDINIPVQLESGTGEYYVEAEFVNNVFCSPPTIIPSFYRPYTTRARLKGSLYTYKSILVYRSLSNDPSANDTLTHTVAGSPVTVYDDYFSLAINTLKIKVRLYLTTPPPYLPFSSRANFSLRVECYPPPP